MKTRLHSREILLHWNSFPSFFDDHLNYNRPHIVHWSNEMNINLSKSIDVPLIPPSVEYMPRYKHLISIRESIVYKRKKAHR